MFSNNSAFFKDGAFSKDAAFRSTLRKTVGNALPTVTLRK